MTLDQLNLVEHHDRITRVVQRFFGRSDLVDKEQLVLDILLANPTAPRQTIHHRCIDVWRRTQSEARALTERGLIGGPLEHDHPSNQDEVNRLCLVLDPNEQRALYLVFWQGLTHAQAASSLHLRPWSFQLLLGRTLRKLRAEAWKAGLIHD